MSDMPPLERPVVVVNMLGSEARLLCRELCAGIEEEGVPFAVVSTGPGLHEAAARAAEMSSLGVGVAVAVDHIVIAHARLLPERHVAEGHRPTKDQARLFGHDAARIVVGSPLKSTEVHSSA